MSFGLAARIASMFGSAVDAVHFSEIHPGDSAIAAQAMPFLKSLSDSRLKARERQFERAFRDLIAPIEGSTFTGGQAVTRDQLVTMGRYASLLLLGRPGADAENIAPATVKAAIFDCAHPVVIAPPNVPAAADLLRRRRLERQRPGGARRGLRLALSEEGSRRDRRRRRSRARGGRHILPAAQFRAPRDRRQGRHDGGSRRRRGPRRGRALLAYAADQGADLLVMGATGMAGSPTSWGWAARPRR